MITRMIQNLGETPLTILEKVMSYGKFALLESLGEGEHFSYIAFSQNGASDSDLRSLNGLDETLKKSFVKTDTEGFIGGAIGYISYDHALANEKVSSRFESSTSMPQVHLMLFHTVIAYDHKDNNIYIHSSLQDTLKANESIDMVVTILREGKPFIAKTSDTKVLVSANETKESFIKKVEKAKEYIRSGDIFQVVLSQRFELQTDEHPYNIYQKLRIINPSPYMYYIDYGDYQIVGSSPEMLIKLQKGNLETHPIAGTRPRGKDIEEDAHLAQDLLNDPKELAEHNMLVDLARNDIGKISEFGTVRVSEYMDIKRFSHVMHISSKVEGNLRTGISIEEVLKAANPAGTVSGAPKRRAMQIIDELENHARGVYAGCIGYLSLNGTVDMAIAIRTIVFKDKIAYIQAGAGIVADSVPAFEYDETLRKANALIKSITGGIYDTDNR